LERLANNTQRERSLNKRLSDLWLSNILSSHYNLKYPHKPLKQAFNSLCRSQPRAWEL